MILNYNTFYSTFVNMSRRLQNLEHRIATKDLYTNTPQLRGFSKMNSSVQCGSHLKIKSFKKVKISIEQALGMDSMNEDLVSLDPIKLS